MAKKKKNSEETESYTFSDQETKDKIHKHLEDKNDVITDKDIKNVKIPGKDTPSEPTQKDKNVLEGKVIKKEIKENIEKNKDQPITPWDILDE